MKNLLILSLIISAAYTHAMDHDVSENETRSSQSTDGTTEPFNFDAEMCKVTTNILLLRSNVAELRVKAIALESIVRTSVPGFAEFQLLSKLNFKVDEKTEAPLTAHSCAVLKKLDLSQEQLKLALEGATTLSDITHEEMVLRQAVKEMQSILSEHKPTHESTPGWCELL